VAAASSAAITTEKLTKMYGHRRGIVNLNLDVARGESFGFLGPNGAGKTTTLRTLLDLIRPTSGNARIFGHDSHADSFEIRRHVGYLPGEYALYGRLTGSEILRFFASLRGGVDQAYVTELGERLGFDFSRLAGDLSTGNKRKLGLIQAFMHRPELIILDEPTSGLDPLVQRTFYEMVDEMRAAGQTLFLSSHVLPEVQCICDRVAFVRDGELVAIENVAEVVQRAARRLEIEFAAPVPAEVFASLPGVSNMRVEGATLRFTATGRLDAIVKKAAAYEVVTLASHEPDLEELFLTFYARGEHKQPGDGESDAA
jgi:ABC-2 type transport system ATP-binding protein